MPLLEERTTLVETPSGKIELAFNGAFQVLQFNCECMDALPYCKAMCCRLRSGYHVKLLEGEKGKYESRPLKVRDPNGLHVLQTKKKDGSCVYLNDEALCRIHQTKPWACGVWHCSPGGKGDGIRFTDQGWRLGPAEGSARKRG